MNSELSPSATMDAFLDSCQSRVKHTLESRLALNLRSEKLQRAMLYATLGGGKRIRPVLVYGSVLAVGGTIESADSAACAVELIHSYSLVHDDLPAMDDDDLRRGQATVHKAFDEATAILVGDALQTMAFELLTDKSNGLPAATCVTMVNELSKASGASGMVGGQAVDFEAAGTVISLADLEAMHNLKTGALIKASAVLGGLCKPDVTPTQLNALRKYATSIGLAFQVQDDILDVVSDTETLGKPQGSDSSRNKPTYVSLLGLEAAQKRAVELAEDAINALAEFSNSADYLRQLASYIVTRVH